MRLRYTRPAAKDLDEILTYVAQRSPSGARHIQARIFTLTEMICEHPQAGQLTRRPGMRRLVTTPYPYLLFYKIGDGEIVVHGIRHAARKPIDKA